MEDARASLDGRDALQACQHGSIPRPGLGVGQPGRDQGGMRAGRTASQVFERESTPPWKLEIPGLT